VVAERTGCCAGRFARAAAAPGVRLTARRETLTNGRCAVPRTAARPAARR
jgi:hypothetical protein